MNAQELRLGNILQDESGRQCTVTRIMDNDTIQVRYMIDGKEKHSYVDCEHLEAVRLTPEWLERMGALFDGRSVYRVAFGALTFKMYFNIKPYSYLGDIYMSGRVEYVHQLQNLYHALTGNELEVKP